jgi:hypothetical protein
MRYLHVTGEAAPANRAMPVRIKIPRERTVGPDGGEQSISGPNGCMQERGVAIKSVNLEEAAKRVADRVSEWSGRITQTTAIEPPIGALMSERPLGISKCRVGVTASRLQSFGLNESP